ncbi:hypothetical protein AURDEDRAFT_113436 [Auricularia subglabra TFB-10046 SS5]|nr:hypothetical protein AURDEDRAFT_113436 [Auricularia subglabra TFB-10046 SS5]
MRYILDLQRDYYDNLGDCPCCVLEYQSNITWAFRYPSPVSGLLFTDKEFMGNLQELAIHELLWPIDCDVLHPATRLQTLTLILDRLTSHDSTGYPLPFWDNVAGVFYDASQSRCTLPCPALKELCLAVPASQPPLTLDVSDVCGFLDAVLCYDGTALPPRLVLRNVHLYDPGVGHGMQLLTSRFSDVQYRTAFYAAIPHIHQNVRATWWIHDMMR